MLIVVEKKESGEDGEAYSSLSIKRSGPFMEAGRPSYMLCPNRHYSLAILYRTA